jgi:hypothetical protein
MRTTVTPPDGSDSTGIWESGADPWVRRALTIDGWQSRPGKSVLCYSCGKDSAKIASEDVSSDRGRVEVYCENTDCDARTVTILVQKDGAGARRRADVRALARVDAEPHPEAGEAHRPSLSAVGDDGVLSRQMPRNPIHLHMS